MYLKFFQGNRKVGKHVATFTLPAGHSCPFAKDCLSKSDRETGKITDGPDILHRCFAASTEALRPQVRRNVWHNFDLLRSASQAEMEAILTESIFREKADLAKFVRVHVGGDYFNQKYFNAWMATAKKYPQVTFYGYTKSLPYWIDYLSREGSLPDNFKLTASRGGRRDDLIDKHGLFEAVVVDNQAEADALGLEVDHDDSHAMRGGGSFALIIHGTQPKKVNLRVKAKLAATEA